MRPRHSRFGLNLLPSALPVFCGYFSVVVGGPYRVAWQTHRGANLRDVPLNHVPLAGVRPPAAAPTLRRPKAAPRAVPL